MKVEVTRLDESVVQELAGLFVETSFLFIALVALIGLFGAPLFLAGIPVVMSIVSLCIYAYRVLKYMDGN